MLPIDSKNNLGGTALHVAAFNGQIEIVELLLENGCNVDGVKHDGSTALMSDTQNGHLDII